MTEHVTYKFTLIEGDVVKKGEKYLYVKLSTTQTEYLHKVLLNEISDRLNVGDHFCMYAIPTWTRRMGTGIVYVEMYTPYSFEEIRSVEIDRWFKYVLSRYKEGTGSIYEKGVEKLKELDATEELAIIEEMKKRIVYNEKLKDILSDMKEQQVFTAREIKKIKEHAKDLDTNELSDLIDKLRNRELSKDFFDINKDCILTQAFVQKWGCSKGSYFVENDEIYQIDDIDKVQASGPIRYKADYHRVTNSKDPAVLDFKEKCFWEKSRQNAYKKCERKRAALMKLIQYGLQRIPDNTEWNELKNEICTWIWDTSDIYGEGTMCFVTESRVYLVRNNMKYDDHQEWNTIPGVGFGWYMDIDKAQDHIKAYLDAENDLKSLEMLKQE